MNTQKLTQGSIGLIKAAQEIAVEYGNNIMEQAHLLLAACDGTGLISQLLTKAGTDPEQISSAAREAVEKLPRLGSRLSPDELRISGALNDALEAAEDTASGNALVRAFMTPPEAKACGDLLLERRPGKARRRGDGRYPGQRDDDVPLSVTERRAP